MIFTAQLSSHGKETQILSVFFLIHNKKEERIQLLNEKREQLMKNMYQTNQDQVESTGSYIYTYQVEVEGWRLSIYVVVW